jgi:phage baseplate assembly protein W
MTRKKALERWETKISIAEVTPRAIWPIAKSLLKRDGQRATTAIHDISGLLIIGFGCRTPQILGRKKK